MIANDPLPSPGETWVIEASAGTGKTWTISTLAARFIAEQDVPIANLAIVTFSSASASEVRSRTRARLQQCADALTTPPGPMDKDPGLAELCSGTSQERERKRNRLLRALDDFDLAPILTTHGFCGRLLAWLGILADHDTDDRVAPDLNDLVSELTSDHYLRIHQTGHPRFSFDQALSWVRAAVFAPNAAIIPEGSEEAAFVQDVKDRLELSKRRTGIYTFDDILLRCHGALTDPVTGHQARQRLSQIYPVVLVDEFQDTDMIQWEILRAGFVGSSTVVLIGDPKQSIYGFRGADVRAYLSATSIAQVRTLGTNHRSSPSVVQAVGNLMNGAELGDPRIRVSQVATSPDTPRLVCQPSMPWNNAFRIRVPDQLTPLSVTEARRIIDTDLVADLTQLLTQSVGYQPSPSEPVRPLREKDVAIIVSTNGRGNSLLDHLRQAGIPAVFTGTGSVFLTPAARDWLVFLQALESGSSSWIRAASLTSLNGWDLDRLVHADADEFATLASQMRHLSTLLAQHGVMSVLEWLMDRSDLVARLGASEDGERTLTDLTHIGHLLSQDLPGLVSPVDQLRARMASPSAPDESVRRLPTHNDAVQILTVHQAKGLQFPVVYLPQLADRRIFIPQPGQPVVSRDHNGARVVDLGITGQPVAGSANEDAGETLRACYVGLTRSTAHITTWWIPTRENTHASPLHRLLFRTTPAPAAQISLTGKDPRKLTIEGISVETIPAAVSASSPLAGDGSRSQMSVSGDRAASPLPAASPAPLFSAPPFPAPPHPGLGRDLDLTWRRTSFSALTAEAHQESPSTDEPADPIDVAAGEDTDPALDQLSPMADLPGGVGFGSLVHSIFEYADPAQDLTPLVEQTMASTGFTGFTPDILAAALAPGLATPLGPIANNLSLAQIPLSDRIPEMGFEIPLSHKDWGATMDLIADLLARHVGADDPLAGYANHLRSANLDARALRGFLTGSIDAVLRIEDRFVIVDYKTNRLGPRDSPLTLRNYTMSAMASAMISSHYPLQALIYAVGLHRFLRWRLPDYDPDRHLGGIAYLFVRGMAGPGTPVREGMPCGVFTWTPATQLISELSDLLSGVMP